MIVKNDLFDYQSRYIFQDTDGFKFSLDSILLAEFINKRSKAETIIDMCAGNMAVPLIYSTYTSKSIVGFEIQENIYELGKQSIEYNQLNNQLKIINDDIKNIGNYYNKSSIDMFICNPPYFAYNDQNYINTSNYKSLARHELTLSLEDIFIIAKDYLKQKGELYLVHRASRLDEIIYYGFKYQVNVKKIQLISTKEGNKPSIVLVLCQRASKPCVIINHELCIQNVNTYQNIFEEDK